jgi:hypothetical protein
MSIILSGSFGSFTNVNLAASNATPPGDPYWSNVSLLLNNTSTNNQTNNTFVDSSTNNFTVTRVGTPTQGSFIPYAVAANTSYSTSTNGGSGYFDGNGNYLGLPITSALQFGNGDFTIEAWVYTTSTATQCIIVGQSDLLSVAASSWVFYIGGVISSDVYVGGTSYTVTSPVPTINTWAHVAFVRNGTSVKSYLNGTQVGSTTLPAGATVNNGSTLYAPSVGALGTNFRAFSGFISNLRVVKGTAVYTGNFTPPTSPVTAISGTSLLLNFTNAGMYDAATKNNLIGVGDTKVSTTQAKFGTTSVAFDGANDGRVIPDNAALEPDNSNLTWEMWINTTATAQYTTLYSRTSAPFASGMWTLLINNASASAGDVALWVANYSGDSPLLATTGVNIRDGNWHHIAVVRNGSAWALYVDGISRATQTWSGTIANISGNPTIGRDQFYGRDYSGYMQDLRITKGVARYTSNFTSPTTSFPTY